jgi:hypothetical protein
MEVHAHTHTERKKFTHYLWEFLMLFLAVFCGFLAENFREHQVEHLREKQYMVTMLEDLRSDTALVNDAIAYWSENNRSIDSVADAISFPLVNTDLVKVYRHLNRALDYYSFKYNDRTISQLKNAGGFRLIRKENVANKIIAYDQLNNDAWINIKYQYNQFYENVVTLRNKAFVQEIINKIDEKADSNHQLLYSLENNTWIDNMIRKNRSPYSILDQTAFLFEFKNALLSFRKDFSNIRWGYTQLLKTQTELIKLIAEEYHLK